MFDMTPEITSWVTDHEGHGFDFVQGICQPADIIEDIIIV